MEWNQAISSRLERRGVKQRWLAERLGVSDATMSHLLSGKTTWTAEDVVRAAYHLFDRAEIEAAMIQMEQDTPPDGGLILTEENDQ